jgi:hypothetical protein
VINSGKEMNMLEYTKLILQKVSFDKKLFEKELSKSIQWLDNEEAHALKEWLMKKFSQEYEDIIHSTFQVQSLNSQPNE